MRNFFGVINFDTKNQDVNFNFFKEYFKTNYKQHSEYQRNKHLTLVSTKGMNDFYYHDKQKEISIILFGQIYGFGDYDFKEKEKEKCIFKNIIHGYLNNLDLFLESLDGAFSMVIVDHKKKKAFLAKDHMGMVPIFYARKNNNLYFSSEIKFFFHNNEIKKIINRDRVVSYLLFFAGFNNETFYKNIFRVPARNYLKSKNNNDELKIYYKFSLSHEYDGLDKSKEKLLKSLRAIISKMVKVGNNHGSKLSGGLDSSTISAIALETNKNIPLYSGIYSCLSDIDKKNVNENEYMKAFEDYYKTTTNFVDFDDDKKIDPFLYDLEDDEPSFIMNRYFDLKFLQRFKKDEIRTVLDGFDGDSVISYGYTYLSDLGKKFKIFELYKNKKELEKNGFLRKTNGIKFFYRYVIYPNLPKKIALEINNLRGKNNSKKKYEILSNECKLMYPEKSTNKRMNIKQNNYLPSQEIHKEVFNWPVWEHILDINYQDSSRYGVIENFPFLSKNVMKESLNILPKYKLMNGYSRYILRAAMKDCLPQLITKRCTKSNISPAIKDYFRKTKQQQRFKDDLIGDKSRLKGLINEDLIQQIYTRNLDEDNQILMNVISLQRWMERNDFSW